MYSKFETMTTNNWKHPELKKNEFLIINVKDNENWFLKLPDSIKLIRKGNVAYTTGGKEIVPDMKPLFGIRKREYKIKGYVLLSIGEAVDCVILKEGRKWTTVRISKTGHGLKKGDIRKFQNSYITIR